ncbi:hypothetical protein F4802DRAFT_592039 [Xylaria palmicola]|nr:hypothetical protein F4802DRAFT_592039 [Xylaria palmicola]
MPSPMSLKLINNRRDVINNNNGDDNSIDNNSASNAISNSQATSNNASNIITVTMIMVIVFLSIQAIASSVLLAIWLRKRYKKRRVIKDQSGIAAYLHPGEYWRLSSTAQQSSRQIEQHGQHPLREVPRSNSPMQLALQVNARRTPLTPVRMTLSDNRGGGSEPTLVPGDVGEMPA